MFLKLINKLYRDLFYDILHINLDEFEYYLWKYNIHLEVHMDNYLGKII